MLATHPTLASLGIASKLQRMQLLNRRDEVILLDDDHQEAPHQNGAHVSQIHIPHNMQRDSMHMMLLAVKCHRACHCKTHTLPRILHRWRAWSKEERMLQHCELRMCTSDKMS